MRLLALETSTDLGSVALWEDGRVLEKFCPVGRSHSETLLPLVQSLLAEAGWVLNGLDGIAFGAGPGAFTGLRVACGVAQGLAIGAGLQLVSVTSLAAIACAAAAEHCLAVLDARMGEVYSGIFECRAGRYVQSGILRVSTPAELILPDAPCLVAGNALLAYPALAERVAAAGLPTAPSIMPLASAVGILAAPVLDAGEAIDPALAAPLYVRDKVAQTVAERLAGGGKA